MIQIATLKNGMRVVTQRQPDIKTVSVQVGVGVGARHETEEQNGISHFLEHMVFNGTPNRSADDISGALERVGGYINANTTYESTRYYTKTLKEDWKLSVEILADMLQHSLFAEKDIEKERSIIFQEIKGASNGPVSMVGRNIQATAYAGQSLGRPILGSVENVQGFTAEQLRNYFKGMYCGENMIVSIAGDIEHAEVVDLCAKSFSEVPNQKAPKFASARYTPGEIRVEKDDSQINFALSFEGMSFYDPDKYAVFLLNRILGGGMSSRLFQEIRERRGLVYSIGMTRSSYSDTGIVGVSLQTGEASIAEVVPALCDEIVKLSDTITSEEIKRAKAKAKFGDISAYEDAGEYASGNLDNMLTHGRVIPLEEIIQEIDAVDAADLQRVAKKIFGTKPVLSARGPLKHLVPYDEICQRLRVGKVLE